MTSLSARTATPDTGIFGMQHVRLIRLGDTAGVRHRHWNGKEEHFITLETLQTELRKELFPQLFANPQGCFVSGPEEVDGELVAVILRPTGRYAYLWFGVHPETKERDGLVHVSGKDCLVWQTYVRSWDERYYLRSALFRTLEEAESVSGV
jgi:hypothetical protein